MEKTVKFKVEKETKNTVKYNEVPAEGHRVWHVFARNVER